MKKSKDDITQQINEALGKKVAFYGSEKKDERVEALPTGILALDLATGIGGLPKGRIVEIYGQPSSGKSTLCLGMIASNQKKGVKCAYIDAEYALDLDYAAEMGVNVDDLIIIQPDSGEEAFEAIEKLVREESTGIIVVDSVSALTPRAEIEADTGRPTMGGQARLVAQGLRKIVPPLSKTGTILFFINQLRMNIMGGQYDPFITSGGMSLKFYASVRMEIKKKNMIKIGETIAGYETEIKIVKNKVGKPLEVAKTSIMLGEGFSPEWDLINIALEKDVIKKQGNTYSFNEEKVGVGINKTREALKNDSSLFERILVAVQSQL